MASPFIASCIQNCATRDPVASLNQCVALIEKAGSDGASLVCLPEFCTQLHVDGKIFDTGAVIENEHHGLKVICDLAASLQLWILIGSIAVIDRTGQQRNRSLLIDRDGTVIARYDKIHMFDVNLGDGEVYRESDKFDPGNDVVVAPTPFGAIGLTVCYDLRFPALYRLLAHNGAQILTIPAAFTHTSGKAHWHVLCRARAIENGCFVFAPCQYGHHGKARTYGHSLIIDPWGNILAEGSEDAPCIISAEIDIERVEDARKRIPSLEHDRPLALAGSRKPQQAVRKAG